MKFLNVILYIDDVENWNRAVEQQKETIKELEEENKELKDNNIELGEEGERADNLEKELEGLGYDLDELRRERGNFPIKIICFR